MRRAPHRQPQEPPEPARPFSRQRSDAVGGSARDVSTLAAQLPISGRVVVPDGLNPRPDSRGYRTDEARDRDATLVGRALLYLAYVITPESDGARVLRIAGGFGAARSGGDPTLPCEGLDALGVVPPGTGAVAAPGV